MTNNFLDDGSFDAVGNTSMVYSKVQWVGRYAQSENPFHDLVHKVCRNEWPDGAPKTITGATAWWNIRPTDPKPHSDLISYCTSGGIDYTPDDPPTRTFIYYLRAPDSGGHLNIYTKPPVRVPNMPHDMREFQWKNHEIDSIAPISNRLISFPIECTHAVQSYEGNRVSIGIIFWNELPSIYKFSDDLAWEDSHYNTSFDRPWERVENQDSNRKLTEDHIMASQCP